MFKFSNLFVLIAASFDLNAEIMANEANKNILDNIFFFDNDDEVIQTSEIAEMEGHEGEDETKKEAQTARGRCIHYLYVTFRRCAAGVTFVKTPERRKLEKSITTSVKKQKISQIGTQQYADPRIAGAWQ